MKKIVETLKIQVKNPLQTSKIIWYECHNDFEDDIEDLKEILDCIINKTIKFKSSDGSSNNIPSNQSTICEDTQKNKRRRGRPTKTSTISSQATRVGRSDSSDSASLNDSLASTSSSRSRRAAAQAADQKLAHVQSMVQLNTKLRRPTNFDEKQVRAMSSPPSKCRRTQRNQSAGKNTVNLTSQVPNQGSSSSQTDEITGGETNKNSNEHGAPVNTCLKSECTILIEKLDTPTIKSYTHHSTRSSRSLDRVHKRKSNDLFNESNTHSEPDLPKSDPLQKPNRNKSTSKKHLQSETSLPEEERFIRDLPMAQSSPVAVEPSDGEFRGFDDEQPKNKKTDALADCVNENTFVVSVKSQQTQVLLRNQLKKENEEVVEKMELTEINFTKSKTKILRSRETRTIVSVEEKENVNRNNETHIVPIVDSQSDVSPNPRSRTKVLKKATDLVVNNVEGDKKTSDEEYEYESISSPEIEAASRTKTVRKYNEQDLDMKSDNEISEQSARSRTKILKKKNERESQSDPETNSTKSRTKTIRKETTNLKNNELDHEYLISEFKDNPLSNKTNRLCPISPAPAKGELVKKRIEDFEKMQNGVEDSEEETTVGRVTRNAIKSKGILSATDAQNSKKTRNIPMAKLQAGSGKPPMSSERSRMTPLGVNNRLTPGLDSAHKSQINKGLGSSNRPTPVETNTVVQKKAVEEVEKKRKEEERLKKQAKEEDAKRKKEKALKATAEETKRKRMEKSQKVAAAREAAEKEKERLAAKAEKEKEEKMRQIAIEKERLKEEHLKKKQLQQLKSHEHEERRKQDEAARLAKLKEQEEEHKRQQAMRERELELLKQQKAELMAEAEKQKNHGGKLGKLAAVNNAKLKLQHGTTPSEKTYDAQPSNCYEITPAREDRPLLPTKTEDDYGIDDAHSGDSSDDESQPKKKIPLWAQSKSRERLLLVNKYIPKKLWDMFMECDPCPDINKIFAGNPIKRRIRTSSAVWRTPPKYSRVAP